jgi:hypothetical protein
MDIVVTVPPEIVAENVAVTGELRRVVKVKTTLSLYFGKKSDGTGIVFTDLNVVGNVTDEMPAVIVAVTGAV